MNTQFQDDYNSLMKLLYDYDTNPLSKGSRPIEWGQNSKSWHVHENGNVERISFLLGNTIKNAYKIIDYEDPFIIVTKPKPKIHRIPTTSSITEPKLYQIPKPPKPPTSTTKPNPQNSPNTAIITRPKTKTIFNPVIKKVDKLDEMMEKIKQTLQNKADIDTLVDDITHDFPCQKNMCELNVNTCEDFLKVDKAGIIQMSNPQRDKFKELYPVLYNKYNPLVKCYKRKIFCDTQSMKWFLTKEGNEHLFDFSLLMNDLARIYHLIQLYKNLTLIFREYPVIIASMDYIKSNIHKFTVQWKPSTKFGNYNYYDIDTDQYWLIIPSIKVDIANNKGRSKIAYNEILINPSELLSSEVVQRRRKTYGAKVSYIIKDDKPIKEIFRKIPSKKIMTGILEQQYKRWQEIIHEFWNNQFELNEKREVEISKSPTLIKNPMLIDDYPCQEYMCSEGINDEQHNPIDINQLKNPKMIQECLTNKIYCNTLMLNDYIEEQFQIYNKTMYPIPFDFYSIHDDESNIEELREIYEKELGPIFVKKPVRDSYKDEDVIIKEFVLSTNLDTMVIVEKKNNNTREVDILDLYITPNSTYFTDNEKDQLQRVMVRLNSFWKRIDDQYQANKEKDNPLPKIFTEFSKQIQVAKKFSDDFTSFMDYIGEHQQTAPTSEDKSPRVQKLINKIDNFDTKISMLLEFYNSLEVDFEDLYKHASKVQNKYKNVLGNDINIVNKVNKVKTVSDQISELRNNRNMLNIIKMVLKDDIYEITKYQLKKINIDYYGDDISKLIDARDRLENEILMYETVLSAMASVTNDDMSKFKHKVNLIKLRMNPSITRFTGKEIKRMFKVLEKFEEIVSSHPQEEHRENRKLLLLKYFKKFMDEKDPYYK
jgi:hypothetical protein